MKGIVDIMKNKKRFFYHRLLFYILGLLIMSVGSNLFLKAALGVAPSCTMALTLSYLSPIHSYALFNFLINSTFLVCEALILHEFGKMQLTQLGLTFVYSLFIEFTSYGLFFIEPHGLAAKILLSVIAWVWGNLQTVYMGELPDLAYRAIPAPSDVEESIRRLMALLREFGSGL